MVGFYTYIHCKPDGTPFYVGKGQGGRAHDLKRSNKHHRATVAKYGAENIMVFIFPCESEEQALADEVQHIAQLRAERYRLSNRTDGGEGTSGFSYTHTSEHNRKMSEAHKGKKHSEQTRARIAATNTGKKHSPETKAKIASAAKGKVPTPETRAKRAAAMKGYWRLRKEEVVL
jgi:hypothetical protein